MKMSARDLFFQSQARCKAVGERLSLEEEKAHREWDQVKQEHFSTIQPLLGCTTCKFADTASLGKDGCCANPANEHFRDTELLKGDESPLCKIRVEGEPQVVTAPSEEGFLKFLQAIQAGKGGKVTSH